jgi:DNA-binding winged helix-turn-helix (wHTH) protein
MSAFTSAASEAQAVTNEIQPTVTSSALTGDPANEIALDVDDRDSNSWVEALLRKSSEKTLDLGDVKLDAARHVVICNGRYARFSPLDFALLLVLARHRNRMMSYSRINREVWGPGRKMSVPRLRVRVFRVRQKLEDARMDGIRIINRGGLGYLLELYGPVLRHSIPRRELESGPVSTSPSSLEQTLTTKRDRQGVATAAE